MLAKKHRFHNHSDLNAVYKRGKTVRGGQLSLKYLKKGAGEPYGRAAVVVSKKVDKRAAVRNRIRRRIYEVLRLSWDDIEPGADMVITVFDAKLATKPHQELAGDIKSLLKKAGLIAKNGAER